MRTWAGRRTWHLAVLGLIYFAVRFHLIAHLGSPVFGWRPSDMSGIALQYYRHGFHFLYPRVMWGGAGPGYVEMEFPLLPFLTALLFKVFGTHEWVNVLAPLACGLGLVWATYRVGLLAVGSTAAFVAAIAVAAAPNLILLTDTGMWADPPMVLAGTLGLYWLLDWARTENPRTLAAGTAAMALAILLKLPALYLGVPIGYLFITKYGSNCWKQPLAWLCAACMLLPSLLWYRHASHLYQQFHNTFGILGAGYLKFGDATTLGHADFYISTVRRVALYHFTPLGTLAFLYGLYVAWKRRLAFLLIWLASVVAFALVAAGGVWYGHYHYLLPLLPVGALILGVGSEQALRHAAAWVRNARWWLATQVFVIVTFLGNALYASERFDHRDRAFDYIVWQQKKTTGEVLKRLTKPGDLLIVSDTQMDEVTPETSMTPPDVFYFSDRRGWYRSVAWLNREQIETLHRAGATYFVVSGNAVLPFRSKRADVLSYLESTYRKVLDGQDGIAFALNQQPNGSPRPL
jgi:hypothetical protein